MKRLPTGFEELESLVSLWAVEGSATRAQLRGQSTAEQRESFYLAMSKRLRDALAHLDNKALGDFDVTEQNLMNLVLSFAHVSLAVEVQDSDEDKHSRWRPKMRLTRTPAGL